MIRSRTRSILGTCPGRRLVVVFVALAVAAIATPVAWGFWTPGDAHGTAAASATTLNVGPTPSPVANGSSVVVTWGVAIADNGRAAGGYIVTRYAAGLGGSRRRSGRAAAA